MIFRLTDEYKVLIDEAFVWTDGKVYPYTKGIESLAEEVLFVVYREK